MRYVVVFLIGFVVEGALWACVVAVVRHRQAKRRSESVQMRDLLRLAYSALLAIQRLGYPLNDDYPPEALEAYEEIGAYLWPDASYSVPPEPD